MLPLLRPRHSSYFKAALGDICSICVPEALHQQSVQLGQGADALWKLLEPTAIQLKVTQLYPVGDAVGQRHKGTGSHRCQLQLSQLP